ncbi:MAG: hypothetical protein ACXWLH_02535 [Candidatus Saccharimonadales bacterium]
MTEIPATPLESVGPAANQSDKVTDLAAYSWERERQKRRLFDRRFESFQRYVLLPFCSLVFTDLTIVACTSEKPYDIIPVASAVAAVAVSVAGVKLTESSNLNYHSLR